MKIISEIGLSEFNAWSGAVDTKKTIEDNNKESEFESYIEDMYTDGLTDTQLNDILWFDEGLMYMLGIEEEEE